MAHKDPERRRAYMRAWATTKYARTAGRRNGRRFVLDMAKARPCADCGGRYPSCCMDFDHLPGTTKVLSVGHMANSGHNNAAFLAEIQKCEVVCANCHRVRTVERKHVTD